MLVVHNGQWYNVMNPADIGSRVEIKSLHPILLFISAKRIDQKENEMMIGVDEEALKSQTDLDRYLRAIKS